MSEHKYDVIIIGAGPAGLTAALYASRSNLDVLIIEKGEIGGELNNTDTVENYTGYKSIKGYDLAKEMGESALQFGSKIEYGEVNNIINQGDTDKDVYLTDGRVFKSKTIILASGSKNKELNIQSEQDLKGRGVSYCAICDGFFYRNQDIVVVGGGDAAFEEGLYLTEYANTVTIIHRRDEFRAQPMLVEEALDNDKIKFNLNKVVKEFKGDKGMDEVVLIDTLTGEESQLDVTGAFIYIGKLPQTDYLLGELNQLKDDEGWVKTQPTTETQFNGIFAVGDVRQNQLRQIATAVGDGAKAGMLAYQYIKSVK